MKTSDFVLNLLYPPFCVMCGELFPIDRSSDALCEKCMPKWQKARASRCPDCRQSEDRCRCTSTVLYSVGAECAHLIAYRSAENSTEKLLLTAKGERYLRLFDFLGEELSARIEAITPPIGSDALITWMPRSSRNAAKSGVDQAEQIAQSVAKRRSLALVPFFTRVRAGVQKELSAAERFEHAENTYQLKMNHPTLFGKTIILIDDIFTTGATVLAGAQLLRKAGAERIICLTIAKTRTQKENQ